MKNYNSRFSFLKIFVITICLMVIILLSIIIGVNLQKGYRYQLMNNIFVLDKQKGILYYLEGNNIKEVNYPEHKINTYNISDDLNKKTSKKKSYAGYEIENNERTFNKFTWDDVDNGYKIEDNKRTFNASSFNFDDEKKSSKDNFDLNALPIFESDADK